MGVSAFRLLGSLLLYYALMSVGLLVVLWLYPSLQDILPIGRVQGLLAQAGELKGLPDGVAELTTAAVPQPERLTFIDSLVWLAVAILGALLAALPVSWVFMNIRNPSDYDQSLVDTIVMLPLVVTSIVVIVQHSLALAFSLAGIAGAARYRNTLKSSGDLLFILLSISIGLAAGIGAVELAMLSSAAFSLVFVLLWMTRYGERSEMKRFLVEVDHPGRNGNGKHDHDGPSADKEDGNAEAPVAPRKEAAALAGSAPEAAPLP